MADEIESFTEDELMYISNYSIFQEDRENYIIFDGRFICKKCRVKFKLL